MAEARRQLEGAEGAQDGEEAEKEQKEAEDYLSQAEEELSEEERRYRQLQQEELLFRIREELKQLIVEQERINDETRKTDAESLVADGALTRFQRQVLRTLSKDQEKQAEQTGYIVEEIEKEHSQVFGFVLRAVAEDMKDVAERLTSPRYETGPVTQELQQGILDKLKELRDVFDDELNRRRQEQGSPQQGQQGKPMLVPLSAEIIMLRNMQEAMLQQLDRLKRGVKQRGEVDDTDREYLERLAHRQGLIKDIWNRMVSGLTGGR
jgi:hypothetical protein